MRNDTLNALKMVMGGLTKEGESILASKLQRHDRANNLRRDIMNKICSTDYSSSVNWAEFRKETQIDNVSKKSRTWF